MRNLRKKLLYCLSAVILICGACLLTACSSDVVRLNKSDKIEVVYDPLGGVWSTGSSPDARTFYVYKDSLLMYCPQAVVGTTSKYPSVRHTGYTLLGWYTAYESETFQPDALGTFVKYAFEKADDGDHKLEYLYLESEDGDFVKLVGEEDIYESFDETTEYNDDGYVGENDDQGSFVVSRFVRYELYTEYDEETDGEVEELYKQIDDGTDRSYVVYQDGNPTHADLQRYEAYYTFDEANRWDFAKDKVTGSVTLYARWKRSNTVLWMNGNKVFASWIDGIKGATIPAGETIAKTQHNPSRENATFIGWYKDAACTQKWDFATDVFPSDTEVLNLYAKFAEGEWTTIATRAQLEKAFKVADAENMTAAEKDEALEKLLSANYILTADIDCGGDANPLGIANGKAFKGTFDGNGYKITNFKITSSKQDTNYGFFRILDGATIKDLTCEYIAELKNYNDIKGAQFGAVAGGVKGEGATITNCSFTVNLSYKDSDSFHYASYVGGKLNAQNGYGGSADSLLTVTDSTATIIK